MKKERIIASMNLEEKTKILSLLKKMKATERALFPVEDIENMTDRWEKGRVQEISMLDFERIILAVIWHSLNTGTRYNHVIQHELNDDVSLDVWKIRLNQEINKVFVGKAGTEEYNEWRNVLPFKNHLKDEPTLYFFQDYLGGGSQEVEKLALPIIILDLPHTSSGDGVARFIREFPQAMIDEIHSCTKYIDNKPVSFLSIVFAPGMIKYFVRFSEDGFKEGTDIMHQHWHFEIKKPANMSEYICVNIEE